MKAKSESEVAQSCPTLSSPMDCSPPGSPVPGILQARVLGGVPLPSPVTEEVETMEAGVRAVLLDGRAVSGIGFGFVCKQRKGVEIFWKC